MDGNRILKNVSYSIVANLVSLLVSAFMVILVPKFMTVEDYGIWQLFLFYYSYLGFFHFGWVDGIYLRYAGRQFSELEPRAFSGQLYTLFIFQCFISFIITFFAGYFVGDPIKRLALYCVSIILPFVNFNNTCSQIMQFTNRIRDYAKLLLIERLLVLSGVILVVYLGRGNFKNLFIVKTVSLFAVFLLGVKLCQSLLKFHFPSVKSIFLEIYENVSVGSKLMFANIASMLLIGIVRYGISLEWDVATFGRLSLTLNLSNFLLVFITAISIALFPAIKSVEFERLPSLYKKMRNIITSSLIIFMLSYYPLKCILSWWLPRYADSLVYMSVFFPICLFESKIHLLVNTYLKSMRKEILILKINGMAVVVSILMTLLSVKIFRNLNLAIFTIVFLYAFRCSLAEYFIQKLLQISLRKEMLEELFVVAAFMISGWLLDNWLSTLVYLAVLLLYFVLNEDKLQSYLCFIKEIAHFRQN